MPSHNLIGEYFVNKIRDSRIEVLRLSAIIMIIAHHMTYYGILEIDGLWEAGSVLNKIFVASTLSWGEVGVGVFFIITGFFCISNENRRDLTRIIVDTVFYAIVLFVALLALCCFDTDFRNLNSLKDWASSFINLVFLPITGKSWWYVAAYCGLIIISPYINNIFKKINIYGKIVVVIIGSIFTFGMGRYGSYFYIFNKAALFYFIGGMIKEDYNDNEKINTSIILITVLILLTIANYMRLKTANKIVFSNIIGCVSSVALVPICSSLLFIQARKIRKFDNCFINNISRHVFAIYLIHACNAMNIVLWRGIIDTPLLYQSDYFIIIAILVVLIVALTCIAIDTLKNLFADRAIYDVTLAIKNLARNKFKSED